MAFAALDGPLASSANVELGALYRAGLTRRGLFARTDAVRLHDADLDELRGVGVECYGDWAVLSAFSEVAHERRHACADALMTLGASGVYYKQRVRADSRRLTRDVIAPAEPLLGAPHPEPLVVMEDGLRFRVRLGDGLSTGLFVDQRDNRAYLRAQARGARVLNLFCYTCSFSVAAGAGGAREVISVDLSRATLARGNENLGLNGLDPTVHRLLRADVRKWLARAVRRGDTFDWVVLDPPNFAAAGADPFVVAREYASLALQCMALLAPGGQLLAVLNHRGTTLERLSAMLRQGAEEQRREVLRLETPEGPSDCVGQGPAATKSVRLTLR